MKRYSIALTAIIGTLLLTGCEMKDELWGSDKDTRSQGKLELSVAVKQPYSMTRAEGETATTVPTDNFPVTIEGVGDGVTDVLKQYNSVSEMPASIVLPVGEYKVTAHTPGEIQKQMTSPYYGGENTLTITKGITSQTKVTCKMKNSRIQVTYGDDFLANFSSWTMTINDGGNSAIPYNEQNTNPEAVYWYFTEGEITTITVDIRATTTDGNTVSESRSFKKADASEHYDDENDFFEGGDAIVVQMGSVASSSGNITGISINSFITFEDKKEQVEIPVNIPVSIKEPAGNSYLASGIAISDESYPTDVTLNVKAESGLQSLFVKMGSTNSNFLSAVQDYTSGSDGLNLIGATESTAATYFGALPTSGATEHTLSLSAALMQLMQQYAGTHTLTIKAVDVNGNPLSKQLKATVTKSETPDEPSGEDAPTATYTDDAGNDLFVKGISFTTSGPYPTAQTISIKTPKGLKSMKVTIEAGNEGFDAAVEEMGFTDRELVGDNELEQILTSVGQDISMPTANCTSYDFPIGSFYSLMDIYGATDVGESHIFKIIITDNENQSVDVALSVTINPKAE